MNQLMQLSWARGFWNTARKKKKYHFCICVYLGNQAWL